MSQPASNLPVSAKYSLTFGSGEKKGTRLKLAAPRITLGRSSDNDITIDDSQCSRLHAIIEYGPHGYEIKSQSKKKAVIVNDQEVQHALLKNGSVIVLGQTKMQFNIELIHPNKELQVKTKQYAASTEGNSLASSRKRKSQPVDGGGGLSPIFKIIVVVGVLFFGWIFFSDSDSKKDSVEITSNRDIEAEIEAAKQIKKAKEDERRTTNKNTVQYKDAQTNYVRGFRDFQKGQYGRARDSFQTCLSLYPTHVLCERYLNLSNRKFNEFVQYNMILGKEYRDRNQFNACMNSLKTVMVMVKDKNSKIYKQAKASYDACNAQQGERF